MSDSDCLADCGDGDCFVCCCCCDDGSRGHTPHRCLLILLLLLLLVAILVAAYVFVLPVRVAVEDASLARLALAGTVLAYDISLAVAVHNRNWAMHARVGAPLDAELLFADERFASVRMRGSSHGNIRPWKKEVYNVAASGESGAPLGSVGVAEFVRESAAGGVFRLQLKLAGEVKYPPHGDAHRLEATCPLRRRPGSRRSSASNQSRTYSSRLVKAANARDACSLWTSVLH